MLQRVGADLFEARTGETLRVIAIAAGNGGVEAARFRYGPAALPAAMILNHPGCAFVVKTPITIFGCVVIFMPGVSSARYDLFEVDANGTPIDLQESIGAGSGSLLQFRIRGVTVPVLVGAPGAGPAAAARRGLPPAPTPLAPRRQKSARNATKKKAAGKKKTAKKRPATKKPVRKKPAKKKRTGGHTARKRTRGAR